MTNEDINEIKQKLFDKMVEGISDEWFETSIHYSTLCGSCYSTDALLGVERQKLIEFVKLYTDNYSSTEEQREAEDTIDGWIKNQSKELGYNSKEMHEYLDNWRKIKERLWNIDFDHETYCDFSHEIYRNHALDNYLAVERDYKKRLAEKALDSITKTPITIKLSFDIEESLNNWFDMQHHTTLSSDRLKRIIRGSLSEKYDLGTDTESYKEWFEEIAYKYASETIKREIMQICQIPCELNELKEEIDSIDIFDEEAVKNIQEKIQKIESGKYQFVVSFCSHDIPDYISGYDEEIELTADEAKGLLMFDCEHKELFKPLGIKPLDVEQIKDKEIDVIEILDDHVEYYAHCAKLENLITYWWQRIEYIYEHGIDGFDQKK